MANTKRGGFGTTLALALLLVIVAVAVGIGLARYGDRVPLLSPLLGEPTQTSGPVVVQGIQRLNELATVKWTSEVVITEEGSGGFFQRYLPQFLTGETVMLIASGEVTAGVNLDELGPEDVRVEDNRVTIRLPEARILGTSLNEDETRLYQRDRGWLRLRGDDTLLEEARRDALDRIAIHARENGILEQAETNAEDSISAFVTSLGYDEVAFTR